MLLPRIDGVIFVVCMFSLFSLALHARVMFAAFTPSFRLYFVQHVMFAVLTPFFRLCLFDVDYVWCVTG